MKRRMSALMVAFMILIGGMRVQASEVVSDGLSDLLLAAQHYYQVNVAEDEMVISRPSSNRYRISYTLENHQVFYVTFILKDWGVWNLENMSYTDVTVSAPQLSSTYQTYDVDETADEIVDEITGENIGENEEETIQETTQEPAGSTVTQIFKENNVIGGSTDWEYVFRVFNPMTQVAGFTGGNHGSETFLSMKMYDDVSGEEINLAVGETKTVRRLVVEEGTQLLYSQTNAVPYATVLRKYTFVGTRVNLDTNIEFIRDVSMTLSYSAMASVSKQFGTKCSFDGITSVETNPYGSHNSQYYGNAAAMSCTFSGSDPSVSLTVGIYNREDMTDNFSNDNKTFLWDMSDGYTKLYFSKYNSSSVTTVKAGENWNFSTYWQCNFEWDK